jgi:hypothetical protein
MGLTEPSEAEIGVTAKLRSRDVLVVIGFSVVGLGLLAYTTRGMWFFFDEWDFVVRGLSFREVIEPHNEHISVLPILIWKALQGVFSLTTYVPFHAVLWLIAAAIGVTAAAIVLRSGVPAIVAGGIALIILVLGGGATNLIWAFQIGFLLSVFGFLGAVLALELSESPTASAIASGLLLVSGLSSGMGVAAVAAIAGALAARRQFRRAVAVCLAPTVVVGLWLVAYRDAVVGAHENSLGESLLLFPSYVATGLTASVDALIGVGLGVGWGVTLIVLGGVVVSLVIDRRPPVALVAPLLMAFLVFAMTALGRAALLGVDQAQAPRYVYIGGVMLAIVFAVSWYRYAPQRLTGSTAVTAAVALALLVFALGSLAQLRDAAIERRGWVENGREEVLGLAAAMRDDADGEYLEDARPLASAPDITVGWMRDVVTRGTVDFGAGTIDSVSEEATHAAAIASKWELRVGDRAPDSSFVIVDVIDGFVRGSNGQCTEIVSGGSDPQVLLDVSDGETLRIMLERSGVLQAFVPLPDGVYTEERSASLDMDPNDRAYLRRTSDTPNPVRIDPPPGVAVTVCGA